MTAVDWLWPDRFAIGKLGIIAGLPDEGKGLLISYIAAQITNGGAWPCNEGHARHGKVILFTAEDDPSDTVVPRAGRRRRRPDAHCDHQHGPRGGQGPHVQPANRPGDAAAKD